MNNTAILTAGNAIYSAKRAKKKGRIEEIKFDPEARRDYLTGFRKRKTQRLQKAAEYAKEQARKERIEARKEIREARKADFEERLKALNDGVEENEDDDSTNGFEGLDIEVPKQSVWENHFEDTEKTTTVTIVQGLDQNNQEEAHVRSFRGKEQATIVSRDSKMLQSKPKNNQKKPFRYLTKHEQKANSKKARLKRLKAK